MKADRREFWDWPPRRRRMRRPLGPPNIVYYDEDMPRQRTSWLNSRAGTRFADFVFRFGLAVAKLVLGAVLGLVFVASLWLLVALIEYHSDAGEKVGGAGTIVTPQDPAGTLR
jgi:hypothetical protein